jgi:hypothetical protein
MVDVKKILFDSQPDGRLLENSAEAPGNGRGRCLSPAPGVGSGRTARARRREWTGGRRLLSGQPFFFGGGVPWGRMEHTK